MSLSGIVSLYFVGLSLGYWTPTVAPEPSGESESRPELNSMFMPQFFWGSVVAWAFVQCHRKTWYWCHGAFPEWEWSKFHGGAQVALEPSTELESRAEVIYAILTLSSHRLNLSKSCLCDYALRPIRKSRKIWALSWTARCLCGRMVVLDELTIGWIRVKPGESWSRGQGQDVP
jgi:hypothetical protein